MGLFSSEYVTQVGTGVTRLIKDEGIPNATKSGTIKSIFRDGEVVDYVIEEMISSIGVRAERMYNYAKDHYVHGLPSCEVHSSTQGREAVEAVIEGIEGRQVLMEYSHYGPPNNLHIGWLTLVNQHGYVASSNEITGLSAIKGAPVYLKNMVVVIPPGTLQTFELGALEQWGIPPNAGYTPERPAELSIVTNHDAPQQDSSASSVHVLVTYTWKPATPSNAAIRDETFIIPITGYDPDADYFQAKYTAGTQTKYWMYKIHSGTYPTLDNVFVDGPVVSGLYFPFTYYRYNKQSVISNKTTQAYLTSKKMAKIIGMDYDTVATAIDENPDIGQVEQAMMVFAVPSVSTNQIECRYLFDYWNQMHYAMGGSNLLESTLLFATLNKEAPAKNTAIIKDAQFKMALTNDGIYKRLVAGTVGEIGTYTATQTATTVYVEANDVETGLPVSHPVDITIHKYCKQIGVGIYEEVRVKNLKMTYYIYGSYTTTGDEHDDILLIPIDRSISEDYSIPDREVLYARSLHFVFNSRVVTEIKWYQTGLFQLVLIVAAIVITIYTYGADGGSAIATALGLSGAAGLIATIVVNMIIGQLIQIGFKLFVKVFGTDIARIVAIVAVVYGAYQMISTGSVLGAPWAMELLQVANGLQKAIMVEQYAQLMSEYNDFTSLSETSNKELERANKLLENQNTLQPITIFGEAPQDFYNRTVHSGNIGVLGINAISSYVDIALTLPKLNDTLGEDAYV